jgi:hypothetical protein
MQITTTYLSTSCPTLICPIHFMRTNTKLPTTSINHGVKRLGQVWTWVQITFESSRWVDVALSEFSRKKFFIIIKKKGDANFILMRIHIYSETSLFFLVICMCSSGNTSTQPTVCKAYICLTEWENKRLQVIKHIQRLITHTICSATEAFLTCFQDVLL